MPDHLLAVARCAVERHEATQKPAELAALGVLLLGCGCRTLVEVGTWCGGTAWFFNEIGLRVLTIDKDMSHAVKVEEVTYVEAYSGQVPLANHEFDAAFLDGDHSYKAVKADWLRFKNKVKPGGIVALHDIVYHPHVPDQCEVDRLWQEITQTHQAVELIYQRSNRWAGIGVVFL